MPDTAVELDPFWRPRDFEAQTLMELLRLSRLTLLYGARGAGKTTLLKTGVLPLLRRRVEDRKVAHGDKPGVVIPFPDRRVRDAARGRSAEIAVFFDRWADDPLAALHATIADMLPVKNAHAAESWNLSENLAAWNREHGLRFFIILDRFEQYLLAPYDRTGIADFEHEFVRMIRQPRLAAHFLVAVRDDADPLLRRFRTHINGFGDTFLRLPDLHRAAAPLNTPRPAPGTSGKGDSGIRKHEGLLAGTLAREGRTALEPNQSPPAGTSTRSNALESRVARPTSNRVLAAASVTGIVAGLAIGLITYYGHQEASISQPAVHERSAAAEIAPAADRPGKSVLTEVPDSSGNIEAPVIPSALPVPAHPTNAVPPAGQAVATMSSQARAQVTRNSSSTPRPMVSGSRSRPERLAIAARAASDWKAEMAQEIEACRAENFLSRLACVEHVRWNRCAPDRWDTTPACATGSIRVTRAD